MTLEQAIYGSAGGLGDYRILAASSGLDESTLTKIVFYSSLGGSAHGSAFAPIYSFYILSPGQWAFTRTVYVGPTPRGSDYLVHTIVLDYETLARQDFKPFVFADAGLFTAEKPSRDTQLPLLTWRQSAIPESGARSPIDRGPLAFSLRALSRGPLQLRFSQTAHTAATCRSIHESLPPSDRMSTTFCTRYSYRRALDFRLAVFVEADEGIVQEQKRPTTTVTSLVTTAPATSLDFYDRWVTEVCGQPELELFGLSILDRPAEAFTALDDLRALRQWTRGTATIDLHALQNASALVLRPENRWRSSIRPLLPGALAVDLCRHIDEALRGAGSFDECARLAGDIDDDVRMEAVQWIRQLHIAPLQAWMTEVLLLLPDSREDMIAERLAQSDGARRYLGLLSDRGAPPYRAFLTTVLNRMRERHRERAATAVAWVAQDLGNERDALLDFIGAMEQTAVRELDRNVRDAWLMAIVRDVVQNLDIPDAIAGRVILTYDLVPGLTDQEIDRFAPTMFTMLEKGSSILATTRTRLFVAFGSVMRRRLCVTGDWAPTTAASVDLAQKVIVGLSGVLRQGEGSAKETDLVIIVVSAMLTPPELSTSSLRTAIYEAMATLVDCGVTNDEARLLMQTLSSMKRRKQSIVLRSSTASPLWHAARRRPFQDLLNACRRYLDLKTVLEAIR
jgi:hypothetical protein